jgi:hypothetical protein
LIRRTPQEFASARDRSGIFAEQKLERIARSPAEGGGCALIKNQTKVPHYLNFKLPPAVKVRPGIS